MSFRDKPENELLVCCARTQLDQENADRIHSLVQNNIDWEYIVKASIRQRVMPLLYQNLKTTCPQNVPDDILAKLRHYFLINSSRNLFLSGQVLKLLNLLKENGIIAIPFKGPVLAESVYGDISLRQFADLDILVSQGEVLRAINLICSHGYVPEIKLDSKKYNALFNTEDNLTLSSDGGRILAELHWEMSGRYSTVPFDFDHVINRLEIATIMGREVQSLSAEDLVLYLCIHGTKDGWMNLEQISCVAALIHSRPDMDWTLVTWISKQIRCERILLFGLFMARDLFGAVLPGKILDRIESDSKVPKLAEKVYAKLFKELDYVPGGISSRFSWYHMEVRDSLEEKIRYASYLIFSPTVEEWRKLPLPAQLWFLHYLYRPIRLIMGLLLILMRRYLIKSKGIRQD
ncbi:MAG: nucleotidyltransferase family protein [Deltaproteobacteria bacterium]|nr:nucleotidyltransferase family protein [Deltaproteobacteria bacterium]